MPSPTITIRLTPLLLAAVEQEIARHNKSPLNEPHTMSSWVNQAISQKLDHKARSRKTSRKKAVARTLKQLAAQKFA